MGKGNKASFWHSSWVNGVAPKKFGTKSLKKIRKKNFTVQQALHNKFWINQVFSLHTGTKLEYTSLWEQIGLLNRNSDMDNEIVWRWTSDGNIQLRVHIASCLLGRQEDNPLPQFGRQRRNQNVNSLHGFCCTERY